MLLSADHCQLFHKDLYGKDIQKKGVIDEEKKMKKNRIRFAGARASIIFLSPFITPFDLWPRYSLRPGPNRYPWEQRLFGCGYAAPAFNQIQHRNQLLYSSRLHIHLGLSVTGDVLLDFTAHG